MKCSFFLTSSEKAKIECPTWSPFRRYPVRLYHNLVQFLRLPHPETNWRKDREYQQECFQSYYSISPFARSTQHKPWVKQNNIENWTILICWRAPLRILPKLHQYSLWKFEFVLLIGTHSSQWLLSFSSCIFCWYPFEVSLPGFLLFLLCIHHHFRFYDFHSKIPHLQKKHLKKEWSFDSPKLTWNFLWCLSLSFWNRILNY